MMRITDLFNALLFLLLLVLLAPLALVGFTAWHVGRAVFMWARSVLNSLLKSISNDER
jgi:hypothetical protein